MFELMELEKKGEEMKMIWVAIENADTYEVSEFKKVTKKQVLHLMERYKVKHDATRFRMHDTEGDAHVLYEGVTYEGGVSRGCRYNLWIARKYLEL